MAILDFLFPKKCLGCGRTGSYFCSQCLNFVSPSSERICPVCERPSIDGLTHPRCRSATSLDGLTSLFVYKGLIKKAIIKLKYRFVSDLATDLVELLVSFCGEDKTFSSLCREKQFVLVPIPLHPRRERWRGFNQAELLGKMIAENLGINFSPDLLLRVKNTSPQIKLGEKERKINIKDAFSLNYSIAQLSGKARFCSTGLNHSNILLFDDVWTSGVTLKEACRTLKKSGAKMVWGLTLAK